MNAGSQVLTRHQLCYNKQSRGHLLTDQLFHLPTKTHRIFQRDTETSKYILQRLHLHLWIMPSFSTSGPKQP